MNRIYLLLIGAICIYTTSSAQTEKSPAVIGKWQAKLIDIPSYDSTLEANMKEQLEELKDLDEVDSGMVARFHTTDLNIIKEKATEEIKAQPEQAREELRKKTVGITLDLKADNKGIIDFTANPQNVRWYFADNNAKILFDPYEAHNPTAKEESQVMIFDIIYIHDNDMRLLVHQAMEKNKVFVDFHRIPTTNLKTKK